MALNSIADDAKARRCAQGYGRRPCVQWPDGNPITCPLQPVCGRGKLGRGLMGSINSPPSSISTKHFLAENVE